jgi:uncharacterized protein (DUF2236 family)
VHYGGVTTTEDLGLFGPDSVSWRVQADPAAGVGGLSALFMQALHPLAMAGVFEHSSYDADFWPRFQRTAEYVQTVNFGTNGEVQAAAARVRRMHEFVRGVDPVTGESYSAGSPELITWIHVTEVYGFVNAVQRGGLRVSPAEVDQYYLEQVKVAKLLGASDVPANSAEVAKYLRAMRPRLLCTPTTRNGARLLLAPPMSWRIQLLTPARPAWTALASLAFCLMPRWARRTYRLPGLPSTDMAATLALRALRLAALQVPETTRLSPVVLAARTRAEGCA